MRARKEGKGKRAEERKEGRELGRKRRRKGEREGEGKEGRKEGRKMGTERIGGKKVHIHTVKSKELKEGRTQSQIEL